MSVSGREEEEEEEVEDAGGGGRRVCLVGEFERREVVVSERCVRAKAGKRLDCFGGEAANRSFCQGKREAQAAGAPISVTWREPLVSRPLPLHSERRSDWTSEPALTSLLVRKVRLKKTCLSFTTYHNGRPQVFPASLGIRIAFATIPAHPGAPNWSPLCIFYPSAKASTFREARTLQPSFAPFSPSFQAEKLWRASV